MAEHRRRTPDLLDSMLPRKDAQPTDKRPTNDAQPTDRQPTNDAQPTDDERAGQMPRRQIRISDADWRRLGAEARRRGVSISGLVRWMIREGFTRGE